MNRLCGDSGTEDLRPCHGIDAAAYLAMQGRQHHPDRVPAVRMPSGGG